MDIQKILAKAKEKISEPDVIIDPYDLTYVWVSDKMCDLFDYTAEELIGKQIREFQHGKKDPREVEVEMAESKSLIPVDFSIKHKSGKEINIKGEGISFEFEEQPYLVGKIVD